MKFIWLGITIGLLCLFIGSYFWYQSRLKPVSIQSSSQTFIINSGDSAAVVIQKLAAQKLVSSYFFSRIYYKIHSNLVFRPGIYYLSANLSVPEIFAQLDKGPKDIKITFPEGWRKEQYAARLKAVFPDFDSPAFLLLTATLEGRLFPDTYYLPASPTPQKVVSVLTSNFAKKSGLSPQQFDTLIIASLVERESNNPKDSALIAGIIEKRLKHQWPLQLDATVQYAKDTYNCQKTLLSCDYWQPIYDTKFVSPYNTYLHTGLPPTPIANPGLNSINAALHPETSDYWYYLTGQDGQTYFSKDLISHQKLIDTYLKP